MFSKATFTAAAIGVTFTSLASTAHAQWIMGGTQFARNYFTEVLTSFTVPPAPTQESSGVTNLWPGIEDGAGEWVLQPVLSYGFLQEAWLMDNQVVGPSNGNPNNMSCPTGNATYCDFPQQVNSGDTIWAGVVIDSNNLGANCNTSTGSNCNYNLIWVDWTSGASGELKDWLQPTPLVWAQGLVFEANLYTGLGLPAPSTCADYSAGRIIYATVGLYEKSGSNLFVQDTTSLNTGYPGTGYPWNPLSTVSGCFFQAFGAGTYTNQLSLWFWN